jgi:heat shock protein HtpX
MIPFFPRYLIFISLLIVGPSRFAIPTIGLTVFGIMLVLFLRRFHHERSVALLGIFGLMLAESIFVVGLTVHFMFSGEPTHLMVGSRRIFDFDFFHYLGITEIVLGAVAAGCAAVFIEFGKSRMSLAKAFPQVTFLEPPVEIRNVITRLAGAANIAPPDVCLVDSGQPTAFTVRANRRYTITLSVGLLESLEAEEVEACLAHEIAHLKNNDFTVRFVATLAKVALFARPLSYLLEPAVYRAREFLADSTAAKLVGGPGTLISALSQLRESGEVDTAIHDSSCLCNLSAPKGFCGIFDKHPALEDRLQALREMKKQ